jgi:hypothetical protein
VSENIAWARVICTSCGNIWVVELQNGRLRSECPICNPLGVYPSRIFTEYIMDKGEHDIYMMIKDGFGKVMFWSF